MIPITLTAAEVEQLSIYIKWAYEGGCYYGCKRYFEKRHQRIKQFVEQLKGEV